MLIWLGDVPANWEGVAAELGLELEIVESVCPRVAGSATIVVVHVSHADVSELAKLSRLVRAPMIAIVDSEEEGRAVMNAGVYSFLLGSSGAWEVELRLAAAMDRSALVGVDPLTGISTWTALRPLVSRDLALSKRFDRSSALLVISMGQGEGDPVAVRALADGLREWVRDTDLLARYDGGEFVVLAEAEPEEARILGARILSNATPDVCVGVACSKAVDVASADDLLRQALAAALAASALPGRLATSLDCD